MSYKEGCRENSVLLEGGFIKRVGLLGGTFSPPHKGHLEIAKAVLSQLNVDEIVFIPCGNPPHKNGESVWEASHRYEMVKLLLKDQKNMSLSDIEIKSEDKSYTATTLTKLKKEHNDIKLFFIVGADSLCYMDEWMTPEIIFKNAEIVVIDRIGFSTNQVDEYISFLKEKYKAVIHKVYMENVNVSSSFLRDEIKNGRDISQYTNEEIYQYILENINEF